MVRAVHEQDAVEQQVADFGLVELHPLDQTLGVVADAFAVAVAGEQVLGAHG
jgi:hypothetical protein